MLGILRSILGSVLVCSVVAVAPDTLLSLPVALDMPPSLPARALARMAAPLRSLPNGVLSMPGNTDAAVVLPVTADVALARVRVRRLETNLEREFVGELAASPEGVAVSRYASAGVRKFQKRPIQVCVSVKRDVFRHALVSKETYSGICVSVKRDLVVWQKAHYHLCRSARVRGRRGAAGASSSPPSS